MLRIEITFEELPVKIMSMTVTPHGLETATEMEKKAGMPLFQTSKIYMNMLQSTVGNAATLEKEGLTDEEVENFKKGFIKSAQEKRKRRGR